MRLTQLPLALFAASALVTGAACTDDADDASTLASSLEADNGALDMDDEAPTFADPSFAAAAVEADATVTDAIASDPAVVAMRPTARRARVSIVWGELPPDRTADDTVHDWSGQLSLNRGALIVRRTVGFEDATDRLLPRTDRTTVGFASQTRPFADGLVLEVLDDAPGSSEPLTLTYTRADGTVVGSLALAQLLAGPVSVEVDAENRVVATALRDGDPCDHGFMRGRWHAVRPGLGRLLGVVSDEDGSPIGHLRGIWGQRQNGDRVVFGKYIDRDGHFRGLFVGAYQAGQFRGRWITRAGEVGRAGGGYREGAPGDAIGGAFVGRWAETSCAADLPPSM